jgi:hypothetical protein
VKNLFLVLTILMYSSLSAQVSHSNDFDDWRVIRFENGQIYAYTKGSPIENSSLKPDLTFIIKNDEGGTFYFRLDNADLYKYDKEGKKNFVDIDVIVDDNDILNFGGKLKNHKLKDGEEQVWVNFSILEDGVSFSELIKQIKNGKYVYVRATGAGNPLVFKFSAKGFIKAHEKSVEFYKLNRENNPFAKSKDNPFNG